MFKAYASMHKSHRKLKPHLAGVTAGLATVTHLKELDTTYHQCTARKKRPQHPSRIAHATCSLLAENEVVTVGCFVCNATPAALTHDHASATHADPQRWWRNLHHILGQVLAGCVGSVFLGWDEPHPTRDVAATLCPLDRHRLGPPWALLVPL